MFSQPIRAYFIGIMGLDNQPLPRSEVLKRWNVVGIARKRILLKRYLRRRNVMFPADASKEQLQCWVRLVRQIGDSATVHRVS